MKENMNHFYYKNNRLQQLRGFVNVIKGGSFKKAAEMMNLSQSAVSFQISSLENSLNMKLFKKDGRKAVLTKEGELFYQDAVYHLQGIDDLFEQFPNKLTTKENSTISIAADYPFLINNIFSAVSDLKKEENYRTKFVFYNVSKEVAIQMLLKGEVEAIFYDLKNEEERYPEFDISSFYKNEFAFFASKENEITKKDPKSLTWNDIKKSGLIFTTSYHEESFLNQIKSNENYTDITVSNLNYEIVKKMLVNNFCTTISPVFYFNKEDFKSIKMMKVDHLICDYNIDFVVQKNTKIKQPLLTLMKKLTDC